jgi:hydroxypyruvate isomerase
VAAFIVNNSNLVDITRRKAFLEGVMESADAAVRLNCPNLIVTTGNTLEGVSREDQYQTIV